MLSALLALSGGLATSARAATATDSYAPSVSFGDGGGTGNSAFGSIAVGAAGKVFLAQQNNGTIGIFAGDTSPALTATGTGASGLLPLNVAVDPSNDALFFDDNNDFANPGIGKAVSDGAPTPTYTYDPGFVVSPPLLVPGAMAVDPSNHDLLVIDDGANRVYRLNESTGAVISSFNGSDTAAPFQAARAIAAGPTGTTYVVDVGRNRVEQFNGLGQTLGSLALPAGAQPYNVAVNPTTGDVVVLLNYKNQSYLRVYASDRTFKTAARVTSAIPVGGGFGLAWDGAPDKIYASIGNGFAYSFVPAKQAGFDPVVVTPGRDVAEVTTTVATGGQDTTAWLEYCPAAANCDGYEVSNDPGAPGGDPASPWKRGPVHANFTSDTVIDDNLPLSSNATWRIRVAAVNAQNSYSMSSVTTVISPLLPPAVTTDAASALTDSEATLNGTIDTVGGQTTYHFEYGLTASYGQQAPAAGEAPAGNNRVPRRFSKRITGLTSGMEYHYRVVATNAAGTSFGADRTFTTSGPDVVAPNRGYEQVTPVDKDGAQVLSDLHVNAADAGAPAIAVNAVQGPRDGTSALIRQSFVIHRTDDGWTDWQAADAPLAAAPGIYEASTHAVSADFRYALVTSNRALTSGAFEGGGNLYVKDLEAGTYAFVGGSSSTSAYQLLAGVNVTNMIFAAGAPDFSWILFWSDIPLRPGVDGRALYRWSRANGLSVESRLPDGTIPVNPQNVSSLTNSKLSLPIASADGSLVAFDLNGFSAGGVYVRKNGQSIPVSVSERVGDPPGALQGTLDWVTPSGRFVFFHSALELTTDTPAPSGPEALYRYDTVSNDLIYVGPALPGAGTMGVYGVSDDGDTVFFDDSQKTVVWHAGVLDDVTTDRLASNAMPNSVSEDGRYFAWIGSDDQAHLYDLQDGDSVCVSCDADSGPSGGRAHMVPGQRSLGNTPPRAITPDGTLYFDTPTRLVPSDHNGARDVYAYKGGRLTLISPGISNKDASFIDVSANGSDVYFQTNEGLVSQDTDGSPDVYDAKVGGGLAGQNPAPPPAQCVRDECRETGTGPVTSRTAPTAGADGSTESTKTNQVPVRVSLGRISIGSKTMRITVQANQRGRLKVSGTRVVTTYRNIAKSGTYSVSVRLSKKAIALRRAHKKFKVSVKVSLSGGWGSASAKYSRTLGK